MKYIRKYDQQRYDAFSAWANNLVRNVQVENRLDAGETAQFTRALTHSIKQGFKKQYPALKARQFLPMSNDIPPGATTINPWIVEGFGKALLGSPKSNKIPEVSVQRSEVPNPVMPATVKWVVTKEQLKQAAFGEFDLNSAGIDTAIETVEKGIDDLLSAGNSSRGLEGFANHTDLTDVVLTTGTWSGASADQITADCLQMLQQIVTNSLDTHEADTFLLPPSLYKYLAYRITNTSMTIEEFLLSKTSLTLIDKWQVLENYSSGRLIMYKRDMKIIHGYADNVVESNGTQLHDLEYSTIMQQRTAGVQMVEKTGVIKADNA